jgi:hypothetical protein
MIVVSLQCANWGARCCDTLLSYATSAFAAATALYQFYVSTGIVFVWFRQSLPFFGATTRASLGPVPLLFSACVLLSFWSSACLL